MSAWLKIASGRKAAHVGCVEHVVTVDGGVPVLESSLDRVFDALRSAPGAQSISCVRLVSEEGGGERPPTLK